MMNQEYRSLKTQYSINEDFADDRLIEVNLLVMHDDVNLNYSSFSKETMENAKETLKNVPILAYIKKDEYDNVDFDGHNIEVKLKENKDGDMEFKVHYLEKPIGVIPETNDYHYEERDGKTYVACKGYLWKEYLNDGLEILQENSTKPISMEILVDDGNYNSSTDIYEITKYRYLGVTVLGTDVIPAMSGAKMDVVGQFSINNNTEFFEKVKKLNEELKQSLNFTLEGGENLEDNKIFEEEEVVETEVVVEEEVPTTEEVEETPVDTSDEEIVEEKFTKSFELSHDDIRSKLYGLLYKVEDEDDEWYWINEVYDDYFIYSSDWNPKYFKQGYIKTDVDVGFEGERIEMFVEFLTAEELEELKNMRNQYSLILAENEELKEFRATKEKEEFEVKQEELRQEKISHINTEYKSISEDIKELFISKVDEYETTDDIDADMCVYIVKNKVTFSKVKKEPTTVKVSVEENTQNPVASPYGDLF